jgi:sugar/nucleoside kinase (ribokinase family)
VTIVVVGDLMVDVVARLDAPLARGTDTPGRLERHAGGSAANVAAWLAASGVTVALVARAGDDAFGREAVAELVADGVDARVALDPARPTGTCLVIVEPDGERSMVPDPGANVALTVPDALLAPGGHLHVSGYTLLRAASRGAATSALARARERGMTTSVDPSAAGLLSAAGPKEFLAWAGRVDLLVPNADEAAILSGELDPAAAARALAAHAGEIVVKLGAEGALWSDGERVLREAAAPVPASPPRVDEAPPPDAGSVALDTTGAGDAFAAGLLSVWRPGSDPRAALAAGCRLAARAVARSGAR